MKRFSYLSLLVILLAFCSGCSGKVPINEMPMYGNVPKTPYQKEMDEQFIKKVIEQFGSRKAAAKEHVAFAWYYYNKGDLKTAMKRFNQAWLLDPNNEEVFSGFGLLMSKRRQYDDTKAMYDKAIQINPNYADAYHNRGLAYAGMGNYEKAISDFTKVIEIVPNSSQAYNDRAVAYYRIKEYNKSRDDVEKAKELGYEVSPGFIKALSGSLEREK
ncbi:MAG: tetratricopeptide repeat protein [Candidatus Omnitrophica bacterium]|nr:tetratricopeptide repeat protein [Candidatus Omnitrophota bacterium]